jgi:hypothetical protein
LHCCSQGDLAEERKRSAAAFCRHPPPDLSEIIPVERSALRGVRGKIIKNFPIFAPAFPEKEVKSYNPIRKFPYEKSS